MKTSEQQEKENTCIHDVQINTRHHSTACWQHAEETQSKKEGCRINVPLMAGKGFAYRKQLGVRLIRNKEKGSIVNTSPKLWEEKPMKKSDKLAGIVYIYDRRAYILESLGNEISARAPCLETHK